MLYIGVSEKLIAKCFFFIFLCSFPPGAFVMMDLWDVLCNKNIFRLS